MSLRAGRLVGERYRLAHRIAVGGMGEVWEAADLRLGRSVAVKVLRAELGADTEFVDRFRVEARTTASINHRNIAAVHDYGEDPDPNGISTAYLVMELVHGEPLSTRLSTRGRLGTVPTMDLLEQAGRALGAAHTRGYVHRDVKPGNILLSDDGAVKLTDFGIAKAANSSGVTATGMVMGTAHYIAPEQARGEEAGAASDVYALGVVGYECLAGHRPFRADSSVAVAMMHINDPLPPLPSDVPLNVRTLIEYTLAKDPKRRYTDGSEFVAAVGAVRRGQPAPPPGTLTRAGSGPLAAVPEGGYRSGPYAAGPGGDSPGSDGLAVAGLAAPGLPPLPGMNTGPHSRPIGTAARRGPSLLTMAFVLLTAAAAAIGVLVVRDAMRGNQPPAPPPPAPAPAAPPTSEPAPPGTTPVSMIELGGRPATAVSYSLESSGLRVRVRDTDGEPPESPSTCEVTDLTPTGNLPTGSEVSVTCEQR
ncbi:MAG: serine/threonine-protein kinase [Pseudonocardia sp.]